MRKQGPGGGAVVVTPSDSARAKRVPRVSINTSKALTAELDFAADLGAEFFGESEEEDEEDQSEHVIEVSDANPQLP